MKFRCLMVFGLVMAAHADALREGLALHYSFDELAGAVVPDDSGRGSPGRIVGHCEAADGVRGKCLRFDGRTTTVRAERNPTPAPQYTVSLWFKPDSVRRTDLDNRNLIAMNRRYQIGFATNGPHLRFYSHCLNRESFGYGALRADSGVFDLPPGRWNHVALVVDGGAGFYLNGRPLGYITGPGANAGDLEFLIGALNNGTGARYHFAGLMDEVRVYDRPLTDAEVAVLFRLDAPKELLPAAPVALGPSYAVRNGRFFLRTEQDGQVTERALTAAETAALLASAPAGGGAVEAERPTVTEIGFSNSPQGEQDVTYFLPGESLHARVFDADMPAANTNFAVQVFLSQGDAEPALLRLSRARGGAFVGQTPLTAFQPGPIWISVIATEGDAQPLLMRTSKIILISPTPET